MRKISLLIITMLLLVLVLNTSFQDAQPLTKTQIIQREITEKVVKLKGEERKKCVAKAMKRANEMVDSILVSRALLERVDTIQRPPKPIKPTRPNMKAPKDDSPVKPLIGN